MNCRDRVQGSRIVVVDSILVHRNTGLQEGNAKSMLRAFAGARSPCPFECPAGMHLILQKDPRRAAQPRCQFLAYSPWAMVLCCRREAGGIRSRDSNEGATPQELRSAPSPAQRHIAPSNCPGLPSDPIPPPLP